MRIDTYTYTKIETDQNVIHKIVPDRNDLVTMECTNINELKYVFMIYACRQYRFEYLTTLEMWNDLIQTGEIMIRNSYEED